MNTGWAPYAGDEYLHWDEVEAWCRATAAAHPDWVRLETVGESLQGRPLLLLFILLLVFVVGFGFILF